MGFFRVPLRVPLTLLLLLCFILLVSTGYADHRPRRVEPTHVYWGDPDYLLTRERDHVDEALISEYEDSLRIDPLGWLVCHLRSLNSRSVEHPQSPNGPEWRDSPVRQGAH